PQELYWCSKSNNLEKAREYKLFDCIECGCCSYVCPSHIPLVQYYRYAKSEAIAQDRAQEAANIARERNEFRLMRIEREKQERAQKHAQKAARAKSAAAGPADAAAEAAKKAAIAAAVARVQAQKPQAQTTDDLPPAVPGEIAEAGAEPDAAAVRAENAQLEKEIARSEEKAPANEQ